MGRIPDEYLPPEDLASPDRMTPASELLDRQVEQGRGDRPAIHFQDRVVTYAGLQAQANRLGNVLAARGVEEEDRVVILSPNQPLSVAANFAAMKLGAVPVPASPLLSPPEVAWVLNNSEARALLVHPATLPLVAKARAELAGDPAILGLAPPSDGLAEAGVESVLPLMEKADGALQAVPREKDRIGVLLYTSGTTGKPKGVVHLVEEIIAVADTFGRYGWKLREDDVLFSPAPLAFAAGYGAMAIIPFRFGAAVSLMPRFEPEAAFQTVEQHHATVLTILPTSYRKMLQVPDAEKRFDLSAVHGRRRGADRRHVPPLAGQVRSRDLRGIRDDRNVLRLRVGCGQRAGQARLVRHSRPRLRGQDRRRPRERARAGPAWPDGGQRPDRDHVLAATRGGSAAHDESAPDRGRRGLELGRRLRAHRRRRLLLVCVPGGRPHQVLGVPHRAGRGRDGDRHAPRCGRRRGHRRA